MSEEHDAARQRNENVVKRAAPFTNLLANPDFQAWRAEYVEERLRTLSQAALDVDRSQPGWKEAVCDAVVAFQEARLTYERIFQVQAQLEDQARKNLKRLDEEGR